MSLTEIHALIATLAYKNWEFYVGVDRSAYLQVRFDMPCAKTGEIQRQHGRKWLLSEHMTKTEIVRTAFLACLQAEIHEAHEHFKYRGRDVFNTHMHIDMLWNYCAFGDVRPPQNVGSSVTLVPRGTDAAPNLQSPIIDHQSPMEPRP
jgi:hypothetical protein